MSSSPLRGMARFKRILVTAPILLLLISAVLIKTMESSHSRIQDLGNTLWPGYFTITMHEEKPTCNPNVTAEVEEENEPGKDGDGSPAGDRPAEEEDEDDDDLLGDDDDDDSEDDGGFLEEDDEDDDDDDLIEVREATPEEKKKSAEAAQELCQERHRKYEDAISRLTPGVQAYRSLEKKCALIVAWGSTHSGHVLIILFLLAAITTTGRNDHIALRPGRFRLDRRVSAISQIIANSMLALSFYALWQEEIAASVAAESQIPDELFWIWMGGFTVMGLQNLVFLFRAPEEELAENGTLGHALMTIPLFAVMALISGTYFLLGEGHVSGLAIHLGKLLESSELYLAVGLYVMVGMLLKQTRLATLGFDILRPWKLPPALLAVVVVALAALPTAYSGASGIFVIAAGGVIYREMITSGADRPLALAATAMSGSLGVVLSPCLLVVIVAALNNEVTTTQLFSWGWRVYLLSAIIFLLMIALTRRGALRFTPQKGAMGASLRGFLPLIPYAIVALIIWAFYDLLLHTGLNEYTAPMILPVMLFCMLAYDRRKEKQIRLAKPDPDSPPVSFRFCCTEAASETSGHIGALLMLMGLSVCLGGVVERGELMGLVPQSFGSPMATMGILVVVLVMIGMTMDPYGAVILVSASIADIAYNNGIDPVHFWMVVLVAFELGYLTPPVALNHLLARQVIGEEAYIVDDNLKGASFWRRYERILLPMTTMEIVLLIVAFVPLLI